MIATLCLLATQQFPTNPPQIRHDLPADTAAIVRVVINERMAARSEAPDGNYLVVADQTLTFCPKETDQGLTCVVPAMTEGISNALPLVPVELKKRLASVETHPLPPLHAANARMVPLHTITEIFANKGWWEEFYSRFPRSKGYLMVTAPVFSEDHQNALIYVTHSCGGLCGTGWLMYMSHASGTWKIADKQMLWIS